MQCPCPDQGIGRIETGDFSSNLTQKRENAAIRCGYRGITNRYPCRYNSICGSLPKQILSAVPESIALANKIENCKKIEVDTKAKTGQQYTRNLQLNAQACSENDRFSQYTRKFPPPCPELSSEFINSTSPKPSFNTCQPSRYFH